MVQSVGNIVGNERRREIDVHWSRVDWGAIPKLRIEVRGAEERSNHGGRWGAPGGASWAGNYEPL